MESPNRISEPITNTFDEALVVLVSRIYILQYILKLGEIKTDRRNATLPALTRIYPTDIAGYMLTYRTLYSPWVASSDARPTMASRSYRPNKARLSVEYIVYIGGVTCLPAGKFTSFTS